MDAEFLRRLTRFDPEALVRLRPAPLGEGRAQLWGVLPWGPLVCREVPGAVERDHTVRAADLLAGVENPPARDAQWRTALPPQTARVVEVIPAEVLWRTARAAARTLREASESGVDGKPVGARALRDALLDHVALRVTSDVDGSTVEVPQRLVQALTRMALISDAPGETVEVLAAGPWVGLRAPGGTAWRRTAAPTLRPLSSPR